MSYSVESMSGIRGESHCDLACPRAQHVGGCPLVYLPVAAQHRLQDLGASNV